MTVKCQNVAKCELYIVDIRCVNNLSECKNCVANLGPAKRKIKIVGINLKSTFFGI